MPRLSHEINSSCCGLPHRRGSIPLLLALIAVLLVVLPVAPARAQTGSGTIAGMVTNRTINQAASGLEIRLDIYEGTQPAGSSTTTTAPDGAFRFSGLDTGPSRLYFVRLAYKEVPYSSGGLMFQKDQTALNVALSVFETGAGVEAISSRVAHTVMYGQAGGIGVLEFESIQNADNKVFVSGSDGKKSAVQLFLPKEADSVSFMSGVSATNSTRTEQGLTYTLPLKPGETEFAYGYNLPYGDNQYVYVRPVSYPMSSYSLLVRGDSLKIESSILRALEAVVINGETYQRFVAQNLPPATLVMINVTPSGLPPQGQVSGIAASTSPVMTMGFAAILVLALAMALVLFFVWKKRPSPVAVRPVADPSAGERMLQELARLDDDFAAGLIPEETYRQQRAEKKAQLLTLMQSNQ